MSRDALLTPPDGRAVRAAGIFGVAAACAVLIAGLQQARPAPQSAAERRRSVPSARAARWYWRGGRTPFGALLRADTAAFLRTRGLWVRPVLVLTVFLTVLLAGGVQRPLVQPGVIAAAVFAAAPALGEVARRTAIMLGLDMLLPLSWSVMRLSRMALPAVALAWWTSVGVVYGARGARRGRSVAVRTGCERLVWGLMPRR